MKKIDNSWFIVLLWVVYLSIIGWYLSFVIPKEYIPFQTFAGESVPPIPFAPRIKIMENSVSSEVPEIAPVKTVKVYKLPKIKHHHKVKMVPLLKPVVEPVVVSVEPEYRIICRNVGNYKTNIPMKRECKLAKVVDGNARWW